MKKRALAFLIILFLTASTAFTSKVFASDNNEAETIINEYIHSIKSNKWDEYVKLFNYDSEVEEDLLSFLKDSSNQSKKEGIHGIQNIKLVSIELTSDPEFTSKGDYVYDVLLDMKVHKASEFYVNGVSLHVFVFNKTNEGLELETVYFKGEQSKNSEEDIIINNIPIEPAPKALPSSIKLYDTSKNQLKTLNFRTYIKDVMPNEIYVSWPAESLKANILAAKTYAWYNIEYPRLPATAYNAHVTDNPDNYQKYVEGSNKSITNNLVDQLSDFTMLRGQGPFDAQYRGGTPGNAGTRGGNVLSQYGTEVLANQGYTYYDILYYYYTNMIVAKYSPYPHVIR